MKATLGLVALSAAACHPGGSSTSARGSIQTWAGFQPQSTDLYMICASKQPVTDADAISQMSKYSSWDVAMGSAPNALFWDESNGPFLPVSLDASAKSLLNQSPQVLRVPLKTTGLTANDLVQGITSPGQGYPDARLSMKTFSLNQLKHTTALSANLRGLAPTTADDQSATFASVPTTDSGSTSQVILFYKDIAASSAGPSGSSFTGQTVDLPSLSTASLTNDACLTDPSTPGCQYTFLPPPSNGSRSSQPLFALDEIAVIYTTNGVTAKTTIPCTWLAAGKFVNPSVQNVPKRMIKAMGRALGGGSNTVQDVLLPNTDQNSVQPALTDD